MIKSLLDTDLYKLTMQAAIHANYPGVDCEFELTNRTPGKKLNKAGFEWFEREIGYLADLQFSDAEIAYLRSELGYLGEAHFEWLKNVRLNPAEEMVVTPEVDSDGMVGVHVLARGAWEVVTLYEIPVLSLLSEAYFRFVDRVWQIDGVVVAECTEDGIVEAKAFDVVEEQGAGKAAALVANGCRFSEFGTRRRRSYEVQHAVIRGLVRGSKSGSGALLGTSNVLLAMEFGIPPIGTVGHEWMMGIGAIESHLNGDDVDYDGYVRANTVAMERYLSVVGPKHMGLALTDTYGTVNYLNYFKQPFVDYYVGVRQDSGDPVEYARMVSKWYAERGYVGDKRKIICFSDSLNVDKCIALQRLCDEELELLPAYGIGTNMTNDFDSEPMNIVMKLVKCGGGFAIKLSDNIGKHMGDEETILKVKERLSYVDKKWEGGDEEHRWKK